MRLRLSTLLLVAALSFIAPAAWAHAHLDHASPPANSTLSSPPAAVRIWFTQKLEAAFSGIEVTDDKGVRVDGGKPALDPQDQAVISVDLKPLTPGTYTVHWHAVSVDTHRTEGSFTFTVSGQ